MSDVVIRAEGLGKKYLIGHLANRERYSALRDSIARGVKSFARKAGDLMHGRPIIQGDELEEVWALKDLDFEIRRGELVGIIGRNGAGKSTLLKILSRITEPTTGRVQIAGRVASLLEVGTGFHLELSGRENIYLNGAILGMSRAEIRRKFDEIVAFAEVEKFLDTPVKRYSSGMYVRLAFAVAAHLEPEVLIIDEVLAVGDAEFQKKCLGRMSEVAKGGRTVLFVSHNMGAIRSLTQRCLVLEGGRLTLDAPVHEAIDRYLMQASKGVAGGRFDRPDPRREGQPFYVRRVTTRPEAPAGARAGIGEPATHFDCDRPIVVAIEYEATRRVPALQGYMVLQLVDGTCVYEGDSFDSSKRPLEELPAGTGEVRIRIPPRSLAPGTYQIYLNFTSGADPAGPEIDSPGIVGEFVLDDSGTRRGNRRNGHLSMILDWESVAPSGVELSSRTP